VCGSYSRIIMEPLSAAAGGAASNQFNSIQFNSMDMDLTNAPISEGKSVHDFDAEELEMSNSYIKRESADMRVRGLTINPMVEDADGDVGTSTRPPQVPLVTQSSNKAIPRQVTRGLSRQASRGRQVIPGVTHVRDSLLFGDDAATLNLMAEVNHMAAKVGDTAQKQATVLNPVEANSPRPFWNELSSFMSLAFFSMIGCALRIFMELAVIKNIAPDNNALFVDLPGNMLGSFFVGLFCSAAAIGRGKKAIAVFPAEWTWMQDNASLQLGLRTGFCGSLTTFASWSFSMTKLWFNEDGLNPNASAWNAVFGWVIGFLLCLASVKVGEQFAMLSMDYQENVRFVGGKKSDDAGDDEENEGESARIETDRGDCCGGKVAEMCCTGGSGVMVVQCTVFLALIAFHMYCIVTYARNTDNKLSKKMLSLVLAPLGTIVRWQLSKVNGLWQIKTFFVGTFLANFLACCIDGVVLGLQTHYTNMSATYHALSAVATGFSGCLSTVSTFMTEIFKLIPSTKGAFPVHSYVYVFTTVLLSNGVSSLIYWGIKHD
jgi:CrcB protein